MLKGIQSKMGYLKMNATWDTSSKKEWIQNVLGKNKCNLNALSPPKKNCNLKFDI